MGFIIFDNVKSTEYGITVDGAAAYNAPEKDVETISIPGRNGDLIQDNGRYKNITVPYKAGIKKDFKSNAELARAFFLARSASYYRLTDSYDTDHFRLARYSGGLEFTTGFLNFCGEFILNFDCKPQRFLTSGETVQTVTNGGTISNPTPFEAKPIILFSTASNGAVLTVNGRSITFTAAVSAGTIDSDLQETYNGATNLNNKINCSEYPVLSAGSNTISWTGSIGNVRIIPRWWTL